MNFWPQVSLMIQRRVEYLNTIDDIYNNINDYNANEIQKILIVFDDTSADSSTKKTFQSIAKNLFIRCQKLNIYLVFITQFYFPVPKGIRLNSTHYLIINIHNENDLQNNANYLVDIDYNEFMKIYRNYTSNSYSFLIINTTLSSNDRLQFRGTKIDSL